MSLTRKEFLGGIAAAAVAPSRSLGANGRRGCGSIAVRPPALSALAQLIHSKSFATRLVSQMPAVAPQIIESAERRATEALTRFETSEPFDLLQSLIADDFRNDRTTVAGGFVISETEAALASVRALIADDGHG